LVTEAILDGEIVDYNRARANVVAPDVFRIRDPESRSTASHLDFVQSRSIAEGVREQFHQELTYAKIKLAASPPTAVTDDKGQFQFTGVAPGMYAVLFAPASASKTLPAEISIKALAAVAQSPMPLLRDVQIGDTGPPNPDRLWGKTFTLLQGHTFYAEGANMKIWNATARWGPKGPYMEMRRGVIFQQQFPSPGPIKLVAWSY